MKYTIRELENLRNCNFVIDNPKIFKYLRSFYEEQDRNSPKLQFLLRQINRGLEYE